jgi:hypothetical protein
MEVGQIPDAARNQESRTYDPWRGRPARSGLESRRSHVTDRLRSTVSSYSGLTEGCAAGWSSDRADIGGGRHVVKGADDDRKW